MTWNEAVLLRYAVYYRGALTEEELSGYLDYYERCSMTQAEIDSAVQGLRAAGFLDRENRPTELTLDIKRRSRRILADFFGLRNSSQTCFRKTMEAEYGPFKEP